ncbi:MAG: arsenical pump-driving ATPase [Deltaproteobacteria bacterium]|nr:arsenical pump-driving ATPase [Deltaproteobacteria bacterium]
MKALTAAAPRNLFFTGKGGVGKTSLSCATAISLADQGKRVLLVSTDPASNLDEVLGVELGSKPLPVPDVSGLFALNVDPETAAGEYRERLVGPYRGVLPDAAVASIEEQLSGACTTEIAAFDEFSKLLGDPSTTAEFDHVIFDTAPTGHTLRLLELPGAWTGFLESSAGGTSCLGPLAGLEAQRELYRATVRALCDPALTTLVLVTRPERAAVLEAERTRAELASLGVANQRLLVNAVFATNAHDDPVAVALEARGKAALADLPGRLASLPREEIPLMPLGLVGIEALRLLASGACDKPGGEPLLESNDQSLPSVAALLPELTKNGRGVVMIMGKGGVGKTSIASAIAVELATLGHRVQLSTTDPACHLDATLAELVPGLQVNRIDPQAETRAYVEEVKATAGAQLDPQGLALLEEELRSPCTEEIAVFRAFARKVDEGKNGFVVLDTAPTGHTLLLLDATEAYHRQVSRNRSDVPESVVRLLPRLRDPEFTKILLVTLPEATPVHEAAALQRDLARAGIEPFAWVINQALTPLEVKDPVLCAKRAGEGRYLREVRREHATRAVVVPWREGGSSSEGWLQSLL